MSRLYTAEETGKLLGVSTRTLYTLSQRKELPCIKVGRSVRYHPDDVQAYINRNRTEVKHG